MRKFVAALALGVAAAAGQSFDIVLKGGRVMDPETGLDAVRDVAIRGGTIAAVSETPLSGSVEVDAKGLVVAPGFIDLHAHGQSQKANEFQARDGVTTALELEGGVPDLARWLAARAKSAVLNYGATVSHGGLRARAMAPPDNAPAADPRYRELTTNEEFSRLAAALEQGLKEGALGIGVPHQYYPGANRREIFRVFEMAARWKVPIYTHVRSMGADAMQEVIANAAATGASLHIVHVNSMSLWDLPLVLDMIAAARRRGLDITTEAYPYTAASTSLQSSIFDPGWRDRMRLSYEDLQWQDTGERLTAQTFDTYRTKGGVVIIHVMKDEWIDLAMSTDFVMIASDGMPYAPGAHPRSAGTFSRVLGRYVRERKLTTLMEGLRRMTLAPAQRLEPMAPAARKKGRLQAGADADITVFNPDTVIDTATFTTGPKYSQGIVHVLVNGVFVVRNEESVPDVFPGRALTGAPR